jgi:hypothetical protein
MKQKVWIICTIFYIIFFFLLFQWQKNYGAKAKETIKTEER